MKEYVFGIDVGGTTVKFGLFKGGELIEKWSVPTDTSGKGEQLINDITKSIKGSMDEHDLCPLDVLGVGMGIPGAVHEDGRVEACVNLGGFGGEGIAARFEKALGFPFKIINDANAAGLGEMRSGSAKGYDSLYFVTLGTGVGGCYISKRKLISGAHGCAGEIGHMIMNDNETRDFGLKKPGCLEMYSSATGIVMSAQRLIEETKTPSMLRGIEDFTCSDIFDLAKNGDALCLEAVDIMARYLARALACVACVCNPQVFVIGGGVAAAGDFLIDKIKFYFNGYAFASSVNTEIIPAVMGNDAGIYGCLEAAQAEYL